MKIKHYVLLLILIAISLFNSCSKKTEIIEPVEIPQTKTNHVWYYFSDSGLKEIEKPQYTPSAVAKPWTEAVRISSAILEDKIDVLPKGYATVNRKGLLVLNGKDFKLVEDVDFFSGRTSGNLVFAQNIPFFSVYKSTFFNETVSSNQAFHPFLVQFNSDQNVFYPSINCENLGVSQDAEIVDVIYDGQYWTCSIKDSGENKVEFSYITFQTKESVALLTPASAGKELFITQSNMTEFRNAKKPFDFKQAPQRLKDLLKTLPSSLSFSVSTQTAGGHSPRTFIKQADNETETLNAKAIISDTWIACLFQDGTLYLSGALYDRHILNNGKTLGMKLPKLPQNFVYGDFVISGTMLYTSWEETDFYKTKRSGFLSVNLDEILYK